MLTRQQRRQKSRKNQKKQSSHIESHIYAMTMVHDNDYAERSPLGVDKFMDITIGMSQVLNLNIKHFVSEGLATVFFRMYESNDGSNLTLRVAKRGDIKTLKDTLNAPVVCNIIRTYAALIFNIGDLSC